MTRFSSPFIAFPLHILVAAALIAAAGPLGKNLHERFADDFAPTHAAKVTADGSSTSFSPLHDHDEGSCNVCQLLATFSLTPTHARIILPSQLPMIERAQRVSISRPQPAPALLSLPARGPPASLASI